LNSGTEQFHGLIDEVAVSNRPLAAAEVQAVYTAGRAGQPFAASNPNYTINYVAGSLSVTPASLTITADSKTRAYGQANPTLTASYSGFVNGDTASVVSGLVLSTTATMASGVGSYPITASGASAANYSVSYSNGTLTVTRAPLTVNADNKTKVYGSANPALTASYTGFVNGDTAATALTGALTTTATTGSPVGSYPITQGSLAAANYSITFSAGTLTVTRAPLTITADNKSKVYGQANPALTASYSGFVNGDTPAVVSGLTLSTTATTVSGVGTYPITAGGASAANYTITYTAGTLTVTPAPLTITADNKTKVYGQPNPTLTASYSGFVNGDTSSVVSGLTLGTTATTGSGVGTYPITPAGGIAANYTISYVAGTLTVTPAPLTITADNKTKVYGQPNPALTASYSGFVNGDTSAVVSGLTLSTTATTGSGIGNYPITPSGATATNYTISYVSGSLTVTRAPLTITADNQSKVYGQANPALTASYTGFVNGDTSAVVSGLTLSTTATTGSGAGTYPITAGGASAANYTISYAAGTLTVAPAPLTITADDQIRVYGQPNPTLTAHYAGFVNGDTSSVVSGLTLTTAATTASPPGSYPITASGASAANYTISYVNGTLTITPAAASVLVLSGFPTQVSAGDGTNQLTVTAYDPYGNVATGYSGTVTFSSSDAQASLPADTTLSNGTGSFSVTLFTAGVQSLTATDTVNGTLSGTLAGITVSPAAASVLVVSGFPTRVTAGDGTNQLTVTAYDPYGNVATGYSGTVTFSSSDAQASLPANTTLSNGTGSFSVTLFTAGIQSLTATDTVNGTLSGTLAGITVTPAAASVLVVSGFPTQVTAGDNTNQVTVTAYDPYGNVATGYSGTVTFSSSDAQASLPANTTLSNGTGSFSVTLFTAGIQTLTATDTVNGTLTGTLSGITVTPAAASQLQLTVTASAASGTPFDITVTALDAYGNVDVNYLGTVTFTTSDTDPGVVLPANYTFSGTDAGMVTFSGGGTLITPGSQTITVTDTNSGISGTTSILIM
jgi:hypothetical protein